MRSAVCLWGVLIPWALGLQAVFGAEIELSRTSDLRIVEKGDFGNARGRLRELLEKHLLLALGKREPGGPGQKVTFVIEAQAQTRRDIPPKQIKEISDIDAFQVEIIPEPEATVRIHGATVLAAGFGVMHFLENYLDVFWVLPGELGLCLPQRQTFRLPAAKQRLAPAFASRAMTGLVYRDKSIPAKRIVRTGLLHEQRAFFYGHDYFKSLRLHAPASPSHNMIRIFPPELEHTHPEIFPIQGGKRWFPPERDTSRRGAGGPWQAWHPCYTSPTAIELAVAQATRAFEEGQYCFSLGVNDGRKVQCGCAECRRVGFPGSYYRFVSHVAQQVNDYYPPHLVGLIAYGDVKEPPEDLRLPENVLVMVVGGGPEALIQWAKHASILGTYEHFPGQGFWIPNLPLAAMKSNAEFYRQHRIRFYRAEVYPLWAYDAPRVYLAARLLWDPDFDLDAGLRRFCNAAFAEGGEPMYLFYRRWASLREKDVVAGGVTPLLGRRTNRLHLDPARQFSECSAADLQYASECIARAQALVKDARAEKRLEMVATFFADSSTLFETYHLANKMFDAEAPADAEKRIAEALRLRQRRRAILEEMKDHPEWFAGTSAEVGDDLAPSWEERAAVSLARMIENGVIAEVFRLNEQGARAPAVPEEFRKLQLPFRKRPARMHHRRSHPWYDDSRRYLPLQVVADRDALHFRTAGRADQRSDHPNWLDERKHSWMAAMVRNVPASGRNLCLIDLDAEGQHGRLVVRVLARAKRSTTREAMFIEEFPSAARRVRKRLPIESALFDPNKTRQKQAPQRSAAEATINVYLTWEPSHDEARLEGTCSATQVDFEP